MMMMVAPIQRRHQSVKDWKELELGESFSFGE